MNTHTEIDVLKIAKLLMTRKKVLIFSAIIGFAVMAAVSFIIPPTFSSSVKLAPSERLNNNTTNNLSALGGIVGLGNANTGDKLTTYYGIIESKEIVGKFINKYNLKPILFKKRWDPTNSIWINHDEPSLLEAITCFREGFLQISKDNLTGFVTISIRHQDPVIAEKWVVNFTSFMNSTLADRQKTMSQNNIDYLKRLLQSSEAVFLKLQISELLTKELSTLMLINTNTAFAYQTIDSAVVPEKPVAPKKRVYALLGILIGLLLSSMYIIIKSEND